MPDIREQFLERLTQALFRKRADGFVLKGGGAMRTLYGSERLTKDIDLDFTHPRRSADSLHKTISTAIEQAARMLPVTDLQVGRPGKAERSPRWKVNFRDQTGTRHHVEIEVSRDAERAPPGRVVQHPYQPNVTRQARFWVDLYDTPTLIATKLAALLGRNAPRDVYDLDLLLNTGDMPTPELIHWAIARSGVPQESAMATLWTHLDQLDWARFESELRDALPEHVAERMDSTEWEAMKIRVGEAIETLLTQSGSAR